MECTAHISLEYYDRLKRLANNYLELKTFVESKEEYLIIRRERSWSALEDVTIISKDKLFKDLDKSYKEKMNKMRDDCTEMIKFKDDEIIKLNKKIDELKSVPHIEQKKKWYQIF